MHSHGDTGTKAKGKELVEIGMTTRLNVGYPALLSWDEFNKAGGKFHHTFADFILDGKVAARPTPVNKDGYLLISAGADGVYGSEDDITNWTRAVEKE